MLLEYIQAAMDAASYEILEDDGSFYGAIAKCNGVYANTSTLVSCRDELKGVLEEWILFRAHRKLELPIINGISLKISQVA